MTTVISTREQAIAFLDQRIGSGVQPGLQRISGLLDLMGNPEQSVPTVHVAGTNGKTTTVRFIRDLVMAHDLRVGTFISPHLERIEERFGLNGEPLDEEHFVDAVASVAPFIEIYEERNDTTITYFEATAAIAFAMFDSEAVDVAIVEVGLGGRLDATNVVDADVSVITGIAMDHMAYLGDTLAAIAGEKVAILKQGGVLVSGPLPAAAEGPITAQVAATESEWIRWGEHFHVTDSILGFGGWQLSVHAMHGEYKELFLPLHGEHQVAHFATAVAAVEALFAKAMPSELVELTAAQASSPGRIEVVGRAPLVVIDGAHNVQSLSGLAGAIDTEFPDTERVLVIGFRGDRNIAELLEPLVGMFGTVIATEADDPQAIPAAEIAAVAKTVFGPDVAVDIAPSVAQALIDAAHQAAEHDMIVVTGSLYVVGEARPKLLQP